MARMPDRRRPWLRWLVALGGVAAAVGLARHLCGTASGRREPGGTVIADAAVYDVVTGFALRPFFERVADDVAAAASDAARVLEIGCGPGRLSTRLARGGLTVTGLDLDPAMIRRARMNAERLPVGSRPSFLVGDVASLAFPDAAFDLVVSTLSMHHWADPSAGLAEIGRVLRAGGRALIWDLRPGTVPFHARVPDPMEHVETSALRVSSTTPWRWPWTLSLTQRVELVREPRTAG